MRFIIDVEEEFTRITRDDGTSMIADGIAILAHYPPDEDHPTCACSAFVKNRGGKHSLVSMISKMFDTIPPKGMLEIMSEFLSGIIVATSAVVVAGPEGSNQPN